MKHGSKNKKYIYSIDVYFEENNQITIVRTSRNKVDFLNQAFDSSGSSFLALGGREEQLCASFSKTAVS